MRLRKVTLNNFRCFERLEVDLHPQLTVIVGENAWGKTAILDGIACALSPVLSYLSSANQRLSGRGIQDTDFRLVQLPAWGGNQRWGKADVTQLEAETTEGLKWDVWRAATQGKKPEHIEGQTALKHYLQTVTMGYGELEPKPTPVIAFYGASRGYIEVPQRVRRTKVDYDYPATALLNALEAFTNFRELLAWFDRAESTELRKNKGLPVSEFVTSPILDAVREAILELLRGEYVNPHFNGVHKFVVQRKLDGAELFVDQLSQGYQSMLALTMDFARRLGIANPFIENVRNGEGIMLIDEVDIHLHPTWQQRVLDDLMKAFPNTQIIVTTHSPQVLSTVSREHIRKLQPEGGIIKAEIPDFSPLAHESGAALARVMDTHREPRLPIQENIRRFEQLVRAGQEDSEEAQTLRELIEAMGYQFLDSDLRKWAYLGRLKKRGED